MSLYKKIIRREEKISVIGLGYVGLPLAVAFSEIIDVVGFDVNPEKINSYKSGIDSTNEVGNEKLRNTKIFFTGNSDDLKKAKFHIVAVPTPINSDKTPNLKPVISASEVIGRNLVKGSIVVYESTVYPGVTEEICIPILEKASGLKCGLDFKVGYSPERINPGDKVHRLENIVKIVSATDNEGLEEISQVYQLIVKAGVHKASSIKVAEAAKVVENSQRDINIAFMNELAMVFDRMGINTKEVIDAMNTKWNALGFTPGLVGGHCIGVDPYYFIYEAEKLGYHSQIILAGRMINDSMGKFVADTIIKKLVLSNKVVKESKVVILGLAFKENTADIRNSKVVDIIDRLREYGIHPEVVDPKANASIAKYEYNIDLIDMNNVKNADCIVLAVAHDEFKRLSLVEIDALFGGINKEKILIDIKSVLERRVFEEKGCTYWSL
ncbi:UDP-N-acetyl-D-galactosamine dehydrogenase [Paenibacillus sp. 598K]|uniref:nucleotide sugar dehydrogenase n=1 Tax=Paenibacillus sp. 598K TaxID=1117987 RepID=UPI000FFADEFF|nr:nucleotide sugar dehydrogenase [Paenibacillus sp. 598K]GBF73571.1 UDP-N-acetyl-D-galactosamine dehydrogenase [Paenibacillus sp. 598K]